VTIFGTFFEFLFCVLPFFRKQAIFRKIGRIRHTKDSLLLPAYLPSADLLQPKVSFHIDKTNNFFFQKINSFLKFEIIEFFIIYYDTVTRIVKLFRV